VSSRRTLILVAAIAIGAVASFLVWNYVGGVQDRAYGDAEMVEVIVVKKDVPKGTFGEETKNQSAIAVDKIPKKFFPPNAIKSIDEIAGKVAINDLVANQVVVSGMFVDPQVAQVTFSDRLNKVRDEDQVAVTISVDQSRGVAALLQPGDYVNILSTPGAGAQGEAATVVDAGTYLPQRARYVYQKVQILAVGQKPVPQPGEVTAAAEGEEEAAAAAEEEANTGLITFIVPAEAAQYIASLDPSTTYLTLVPKDYEPRPMPEIDYGEPLPGEVPSKLTPYGPEGPE
jgi:pilus assembly protein CpaB